MSRLKTIAGPTLYFDANILIYAIEGVEPWVSLVRPLFARVESGELQAATSELALAEVLVLPLRKGLAKVAQEYVELLGEAGPLIVEPVMRDVLSEAARLRAQCPALKLPDAIHAATALLRGCTTFLSNDGRFEAVAELPLLLLPDLSAG